MNNELIKAIQAPFLKDGRPEVKTGMEVEIHQRIDEWNKTRIQKFKGLVIDTQGKTDLEKTITVRRVNGGYARKSIYYTFSYYWKIRCFKNIQS